MKPCEAAGFVVYFENYPLNGFLFFARLSLRHPAYLRWSVTAERLQKVLASAGVASRRDCESLIVAGRVAVNGKTVYELGTRVDLTFDVVTVDGAPVVLPAERVYIMLHKPAGYVSTAEDPQGRPIVLDLVPIPVRVFSVGRLDVDSEGLLLLTNDGELTHQLTHPSFAVEKEYRALLDRPPDPVVLRDWRAGVMLNGERTAPAWVEVLERTNEGTWIKVVLQEGRKRQIREVARLLGYHVRRLIRVREGNLQLGDLPPGEWRELNADEVRALRRHANAPQERAVGRSNRPAASPREHHGDSHSNGVRGRNRTHGFSNHAARNHEPGRSSHSRQSQSGDQRSQSRSSGNRNQPPADPQRRPVPDRSWRKREEAASQQRKERYEPGANRRRSNNQRSRPDRRSDSHHSRRDEKRSNSEE